MDYIKTAHGVYYLQYHVVWVCKYRRQILNPGVCGYIRKLLPKLLRSMPGVKLETIGFDKDHLLMVMSIPPRYSISSVMGKLKSQSASQLRRKFSWLAKVYWNENIVWSPDYFVSSVDVDEQTIKNTLSFKDTRIQDSFNGSCKALRTPGMPGGIYHGFGHRRTGHRQTYRRGGPPVWRG